VDGLDINYFTKTELPENSFDADGVWKSNWAFLGTDDENKPIVAVEMSDQTSSVLDKWYEQQIKAVDLRSCAMQFSVDDQNLGRAAVLGAGKSLLDWHFRHSFCAECGSKTKLTKAGYQRVCIGDECKAEHFPRTDPVVIMLVIYGDMCLLGRSPNFTQGSYSALAGFMEQGETIEEAVKREVMEEVALNVDGVEYVLSQPWPFPSSLMIGCTAIAKDKNFKIDGNEIESAKWFTKKEVLAGLSRAEELDYSLPPKLAIAHDLLQNWLLHDKN